MPKIIGIDLGTTNSCVAVMEGGDAVVIPNAEGGRTTPSIVAYTAKNERLVGQVAKNQMVTNPASTVFSVKRFMGRRFDEVEDELKRIPYKVKAGASQDVRIECGGKELSPPEISAAILQKMKDTAEQYLGEEVKEAVITVPAYFNDAQRQATKDAGRIAGLEVKRIVNEPTAAALAYGLEKGRENHKIAVYDLGGGTFDISILELGGGVFEVKSTNGDTHLGGDNFDQAVMDWLIQNFHKDQGIDLSQDTMALQRLKEAAEKAKKELSSVETTDINLPFISADSAGPKHLLYTLTRAQFEQMVASLVDRTKRPCLEALKDAGYEVTSIDEVVLVGGSTRMPAVQKMVKELFKKDPHKGVNPDEVVAMGAAIQGGILRGDVNEILLLDVTPLSLGIETYGGVMTRLITKNTTIPTKKSEIFSTAADNQNAVTIHVLQGEREMATQNRSLGRFDLVGIPPAPRGVPQIEVSFDIDANGIVHVSAKDLATNKEQKIRIESSSGLSEEEIKNMIKDAELHAEEDQALREKVKVKNEADTLIYQTQKAIEDLKEALAPQEKETAEALISDLQAALEKEEIEIVKTKTEELRQNFHTLSEKLYQKNQGTGEQTDTSGAQNDGQGSETTTASSADYEVVDEEQDSQKDT